MNIMLIISIILVVILVARRSNFPIGYIIDYTRKLEGVNKKMYLETDKFLDDIFTNDIKQDAFWDLKDVLKKLKSLGKVVENLYPLKVIREWATTASDKIAGKAILKVKQEVIDVLKHDLRRNKVQTKQVIKSSITTNVSYVKTIPIQYHQKH